MARNWRLAAPPNENLDKHIVATRDSAAMMRRPHLWPQYPLLPLKRWHDGRMETAVVFYSGEDTLYIAHVNLFTNPEISEIEGDLANPDALVADGWEVD